MNRLEQAKATFAALNREIKTPAEELLQDILGLLITEVEEVKRNACVAQQ